jgi:hypothetical protein
MSWKKQASSEFCLDRCDGPSQHLWSMYFSLVRLMLRIPLELTTCSGQRCLACWGWPVKVVTSAIGQIRTVDVRDSKTES